MIGSRRALDRIIPATRLLKDKRLTAYLYETHAALCGVYAAYQLEVQCRKAARAAYRARICFGRERAIETTFKEISEDPTVQRLWAMGVTGVIEVIGLTEDQKSC